MLSYHADCGFWCLCIKLCENEFWIDCANFDFVLWLDYEYSLWGIPEGSSERERMKHEVHLRSAEKLRDLCFKNGGIYIKLGQHLGQLVYFSSNCVVFYVKKMYRILINLPCPIAYCQWQEYLVPKEYVQTMRESMLNRCPVSSYEQICNVFKKEFGETPDKVFIICFVP